MKRKYYGRDAGLTLRMLATSGLLGLLYVVFALVLFYYLNVGLAPMLVIIVVIAAVQYWTSDKLALAASGAKIVTPEQAPDLHAMVERLCAMADLPKPRVAVIPSDVPNAFATGRNPKHAAVAVTEGLWRRLEPKEVEAVLAHELSHVANRDVLIMTLASFFAMLAALITRWGFYFGMFGGFGGGNRSNNNNGNNGARLAHHPRRLDRHLRDQLHPDPDDLALPRVRGRPRLRADHRRAGEPDERAAEDRERHHADPAAGPARGRRHERLLHRPDELAPAGRRALHGSPADGEAPRRPLAIAREMGKPVA